MLSVLWPTRDIALDRGTPDRSRFLTAVLLKSCGMRPGIPASLQAVSAEGLERLAAEVDHVRDDLPCLLLDWVTELHGSETHRVCCKCGRRRDHSSA
jgi:hypothetical protein